MTNTMKKGQAVSSILVFIMIILFAILLFIYSNQSQNIFTGKAVSGLNCTSDWQCTDWSVCIERIQIRSCVDFNTCKDNSTRPPENQSCITCTPNWECTIWQPEQCPKEGIQTKNCADLNNCGIITGKPAETKSCTYEPYANWLFILIVIIIILMILANITLIIKQLKKLNPQNIKKSNIQTNIQPKKLSGFHPQK